MVYSSRSRLRHRGSKIFFYSRLFKLIFFGVIFLFLFSVILFAWYSRDLPRPGKLSPGNLAQSTRIYDRNDILLYNVYSQENRIYVRLTDVPKNLQEATIAIEDKDFYSNEGYSIAGYFRALRNILLFRGLSGGSTITQQLVKNTLLTSERTIPRKIKEFILSLQIGRIYNKDQILELYLNAVPYGGTSVGVEAASQAYFGKKAKDLDLVESAILAGFPQRPSYYSPYGQNSTAYIDRTKQVLRRMREDGYIGKKEEEEAAAKLPEVKFLPSTQSSIKAPHFSFYVKDLLTRQFGEDLVEHGGLEVKTTLDYNLQKEAEKIVSEEIANARSLNVSNGAGVIINPKNGEILSMVGSRDFFATEAATPRGEKKPFEGQFNVTVQGLRQPGSAIKPVTYATALEKGYTASSLIMDTKTVFPDQGGKDYIPENYDGKFHGPLQVRFALGSSINIPAVKMLAQVGLRDMLTTANNMGLATLAPSSENLKRFGLSITLGGGEVRLIDMAAAYSSFANGGFSVSPVAVTRVTDSKGKALFEYKESKSKKQILTSEVAFIISHILLDNNARLITFGENSFLNVRGRTIAVKTGTTDDKRDNWTIGWTPSILVATWVGNNDNSPMGNVASGVTGSAPVWRRIILEALSGKPDEAFEKPENVVAVNVDSLGGGLPVEGKPTRTEYFIKGTEPKVPSSIYKEIEVSKADTNKIASPSEIDKGEYETRKFIEFHENDLVSTDGKNRWQDGINEWIRENYKDDPLYRPPTEISTRVVENTPTPTLSPTPTPTP